MQSVLIIDYFIICKLHPKIVKRHRISGVSEIWSTDETHSMEYCGLVYG